MSRRGFLTNMQPSEIIIDAEGKALWEYSCGNLFGAHVIWLRFGSDRQLIDGPSLTKKHKYYEVEDEDEEDEQDDRIDNSPATDPSSKPWWKFW